MKRLMLAAVMMVFSFTCNAEPLKHFSCDINSPTKVCSAQRVAQQNTCSCTTYAGYTCSGPCTASGKPYGCLCK